MTIASILTQAQAAEINIETSIRQWLYSQVVQPYNTAATAQGLNQGMTLKADGTYVADTLGLGLMDASPEDRSVYERVPVLAYSLDVKAGKDPIPTGMGDGAQWEYTCVRVCCIPAVSTDGQKIQADRVSMRLLKTYMKDAITRANIMPIVDHSQSPVNGLYPQVGYAEICNRQVLSMDRLLQMLDDNRLRFDVLFDLRFGVATTN